MHTYYAKRVVADISEIASFDVQFFRACESYLYSLIRSFVLPLLRFSRGVNHYYSNCAKRSAAVVMLYTLNSANNQRQASASCTTYLDHSSLSALLISRLQISGEVKCSFPMSM